MQAKLRQEMGISLGHHPKRANCNPNVCFVEHLAGVCVYMYAGDKNLYVGIRYMYVLLFPTDFDNHNF